MPTKQSLVWLYGKHYPACAVSVLLRMRTTVLTWWVRRVRVYPRFSCVQSFNIVLGEVAESNRRVNERCRFMSGIEWVRALGRVSRGRKEVDALQGVVFVPS